MALTEFLVEHITGLISTGGYPIIAVLMALESMIAPVPSEAVMPFAGFLVNEGRLSFELVVFAATAGSMVGSLLSYYAGMYGGRPLIQRYGKYLLLDMHHLELTEKFFAKYGHEAVFISMFVPVVRHLISIPAGIGEMNIWKFSLYTLAGAGMWNAFLTYVGYTMRDNWREILKYTEILDMVMIAVILVVAGLFVYGHIRRKRA